MLTSANFLSKILGVIYVIPFICLSVMPAGLYLITDTYHT